MFRNPAVIIALILLIVLLFGSKRLPDVAKSIGSSLKIFKKEVKELRDDDEPAEGATGTAAPTSPGTTGPATASASTPAGTTDQAPAAGDPKNL
ncbi:twin-arginine translocase TatA/TatE family subunit [Isoptericola croceus]|uniref:twin-arginine translocase TatA/TatE family subunit n=1 Tax=Isoptericola croceus TaxID=3031406 RepID=UPI0023F8545A|nr:twin-arginine translocase TatA/TatE family subunit [Isoptericola croceus]